MDNQEKSRPHEEIVASIKAVIETHVKPAVAGHGGTVNFIEFKDGLLTLQMSGACSGCAGSQQTLKYGIENMMKHYVPEVLAIEGEDDPNHNDPFYDRWAGFDQSMDNMPEDM
jgi:Fe-S cluster biogenesis protein NfuA|tara:strand:- start:1368 stop:1706 length:339 start_codon:yes stop_codon:yes gene_type:complete